MGGRRSAQDIRLALTGAGIAVACVRDGGKRIAVAEWLDAINERFVGEAHLDPFQGVMSVQLVGD